ncbi:MAG: LemA family protein [Candidatus Pacearchaeota archaeon]
MFWWLALIVVVALVFIYYFNKFVILGNRIDNSLAQIDVQLRKRAELVPNLVNVVKGYVKHEKAMITKVTEARKALIGAKDIVSKMKAGNQLETALKNIFALAENYPQLKANENFLRLQEELSAIEDKIAYARQFYNDSVLDYNNSIKTFPALIFAAIFRAKEKEFLQLPEAKRAVPKVEFE